MDKLPNANANTLETANANSSHIITADKSWSVTNTNTLLKWITIGSHYIKVLEQNIADNRMIIRCNTIQSIALTTATGSIGVSQISSMFSAQTQLVLTMIFTIMSFFLTLSVFLFSFQVALFQMNISFPLFKIAKHLSILIRQICFVLIYLLDLYN